MRCRFTFDLLVAVFALAYGLVRLTAGLYPFDWRQAVSCGPWLMIAMYAYDKHQSQDARLANQK